MSKEAIAIKALEALARLGNGDQYGNSTVNVIARAALFEMAEQPRAGGTLAQQNAERGEPVATLYGTLPVYDKPAQQDLPDLIAGALGVSRGTAYDMMREALAEQQEPMAWIERDMNCDDFDPDSVTCQKPDISSAGWEWVPLYTTPQAQPAREPLTDALWGLLDAVENELNRRAIPEAWLLMAHKAGRAYIESRGITKGNT